MSGIQITWDYEVINNGTDFTTEEAEEAYTGIKIETPINILLSYQVTASVVCSNDSGFNEGINYSTKLYLAGALISAGGSGQYVLSVTSEPITYLMTFSNTIGISVPDTGDVLTLFIEQLNAPSGISVSEFTIISSTFNVLRLYT